MPKVNRKPGIHLHCSAPRVTEMGVNINEYYWILIAKNGKTIARSSETYKRKGSAVKSIAVAEEIFDSKGYFYDHTTGGVGVEEVAIKGNKSK